MRVENLENQVIKNQENHLAREALWFEEVIYEKCQQLVKNIIVHAKFNTVTLIYVTLFSCGVLKGPDQTSDIFEISRQ